MRKSILAMVAAIAVMGSYAQTPVYNAQKITGNITVDGNLNESSWQVTTAYTKAIVGTPNNTVKFGALWNSQYLYVGYTVIDGNLYNDSQNDWDDDAVELYIDADNNGGTTYGANDRQFAKGWNSSTLWEKASKTTGVLHAWTAISGGYSVELAIPWSNIAISNPAVNFRIGFDVANDDDDNAGARESQLMWAGDNDNWQYPRNFGDLVLVDAVDTQAPTAPSNLAIGSTTQTSASLTWTASTDNVSVTGYDVYRNGTKINSSIVTTTSYTATGLTPATAYSFYVVARDAAGNTSSNSNTVNITIPDTQAPTAPSGLSASSITQTSTQLNWSASTDNLAVTGYDVYQDNLKITATPVSSTTFNVGGLTASTTYAFYVRALDAAGNTSSNSNTVNITTLAPPDTQAPTAPGDPIASSVNHNSFVINWTAATDNIAVTGYDIFVNGSKVNATINTSTSYTVSGLTELTTYSVYVVALDAAGNSSNSGTTSVTTIEAPDTQAPTAPTGLSASSITETTLTLNWNASSDNKGVAGYDIYQNGVKINPAPVTALSFDVSGLSEASSYSYYIKAFDAAGNTSSNSNTINITTVDSHAPTAPTNLAISNLTQSSLTLTWTASTDNRAVTGYDVYQNDVKINSVAVTATTYSISGLSAAATYSFYIKAFDAAGNVSAASSTATITTPDTQAPTAPSGLAASAVTATSLSLTWTASTDNVGVVGYDVYQNGTKITSSPVAATAYSVTALTNGTSYSFVVRAIDNAGNTSSNSNTVSVTTPDNQAPSAPANLASSNLASTTLTLTWSASTDNVGVTGYDVYSNGTKINASLVTATSYGVTGLTANTAYSFYVQASDAAGNISANSNTINVTTPTAGTCTGTGAINYQRWNNITGTSVSNLTSNASYPNSPSASGTLTSFEIPSNSADNYGIKVYGYICPPATGSYTFWIASDDNSELWLSTNSSSANKQRIAYQTSWTNSREWNKQTTQKSAAITLTAGQLYYVEALMKEGSQGDNMAVGWAKPGQSTSTASEVIPGSSLLTQIPTIPDTQAPTAPANLATSNVTATSVTLNWSAATDNIAVTGYDVYKDGVKINASNVTGTSYTASSLVASTTYAFFVRAKDAAGNISSNSNTVNVTTLDPPPGMETFTQRTVIANQRMPHDLVYGPDGNIWYTERFAGRVNFVVPSTGAKTTVLTLGSKFVNAGGQDGLLGLALHPQFLTGKPYVYISYTYQSTSSTVRKTRIERYTYNSSNKTLESPVTILENIPGSNDHNSARLAIGPDLKLYYSVGDMGAGQFDNQNRTNNAQDLNILEGKILRLNTEIVGSSWIPTDNPFTNGGQPTAVYSFGHRNPQGLVWGNVNGTNILYSSEHGPYSDDEINVIESGRNYGWPRVSGFCDGNYNGRTIGGFAVVSEQNNCATLNAKEPLRSIFPAANPPQEGTDNMTWPSMAPSGTDFYSSTGIPGWQNSLLVAMLKSGTITRFKLSSDGQTIISDTINYFRGKGRFRDVVVSPDGLKIYVACDSSGSTSGPTGGVTTTPANPGSILEFTYVPSGSRSSNEIVSAAPQVPDETNDKSIDVYPNPASTFIIVYNYKAGNTRNIELVDINGKVVRKIQSSTLATRIETGQLGNGLYILKVKDERGKTLRTEKVILVK